MSYAICRMQKMKKTDLKGMQYHNQRERESRTNFDIDVDKTKDNYDLVNDKPIDYNERVNEIIESQKTTTRKVRKDAVMVNELIVTSDRDFFDRLSPEDEKRFFEESKALFEERYGKQNMAYAMVHVDEKTPHMHLGVVPMRDGKLQGKNVFNREELRWLQDEFPKHMKSKGFDLERGEPGSDRKHLSAQRYKLQTLKDEIKTLEGDLKAVQELDKDLSEITSENKEKRSMGFVGPEKVEMPKENYEKLYQMAHRSYEHAKERNEMEQQRRRDQERMQRLHEENRRLEKEKEKQRERNQELEKEVHILRKALDLIKEKLASKVKDISELFGYTKLQAVHQLNHKTYPKRLLSEDENDGKDRFQVHLYNQKKREKEEKERQRQERKKKNRDRGMEM